jgi:hypothetical protein
MTTYKVAELDGVLLDAAVAKAEGLSTEVAEGVCFVVRSVQRWHISCGVKIPAGFTEHATPFRPSTDGRDGMPIIERERITIRPSGLLGSDGKIEDGYVDEGDHWYAHTPGQDHMEGTSWLFPSMTPLIAAMRAYCASRFGETVELP